MRSIACLLIGLILTAAIGCEGGAKPTNDLKAMQEQKQKEQMKKAAPND